MMICFIIVAGFGAREFINQPIRAGSAEASSVLSFGTAIIGFQVAWLPAAADYGVYMREDISIWTTFGFTYGGLITSQLFIEFLGAAVGTLAYSTNTVFLNAYDQRGMGGMIGVLFDSYGTGARGFGKLVEALLSFSTCAVIGTGIYSMGLSVQMISKKWLVVPRLVWSAGGSIAFLVCAIVGRNDLETVMSNFLSICAYWIVPFSTVVLLEHFIWRRHFDYDLDAWNDRMSLPYGISATIAFIVGTATALLAMSQTWWIGPIAKSIGNTESGTDISWMLAFSISSILFIPLRHFERKIFVH